jgi:hypothetical protein
MNWARDNTGLNDRDLEHVFKYEGKPTTVVQMMEGAKVMDFAPYGLWSLTLQKNPIIWSLEGQREWADWLQGASCDCFESY